MTVWIRAPYAFTVIMRQRVEQRNRREELALMDVRSVEDDAELAMLTSQANGYKVPIYAGLQEVDDLVASHPIVARMRVKDDVYAAERRMEADRASLAATRAAAEAERAEAAALPRNVLPTTHVNAPMPSVDPPRPRSRARA